MNRIVHNRFLADSQSVERRVSAHLQLFIPGSVLEPDANREIGKDVT